MIVKLHRWIGTQHYPKAALLPGHRSQFATFVLWPRLDTQRRWFSFWSLISQSEYSDLSYTETETHIITLKLLHDQHDHSCIHIVHRLLSNIRKSYHNLDISDIIYYLAIANIKQWMRYSLRFASHWNVPVFTTGGMEETFRDKSSEYRLELQTKVREDFTITEKVHTGPPPSWKRAPTSAFTFKTFYIRPYVKQG